jgi:hypothetical protein
MGQYQRLTDRGKSITDVYCVLVVIGALASLVAWVATWWK